jgi:anti-sigma B factor antagonist
MLSEFSINIDYSKDIACINIKGEIDIYTCSSLRETLQKIEEEKPGNFILDLDKVQYIDSTGLGTIAHTAQKLEEKNNTIYIVCTKPQIKKLFEVSGLLRKNIKLIESVEAVIAPAEEVK